MLCRGQEAARPIRTDGEHEASFIDYNLSASTMANLAGEEKIMTDRVSEAIQLRLPDLQL